MLIVSLWCWQRQGQQILIILVIRPRYTVRAAAATPVARWPQTQVTPAFLSKPLSLQRQATIPRQSNLRTHRTGGVQPSEAR